MTYAGDEDYSDDVTSPLIRPQAPVNRRIASYLDKRGGYEAVVTKTPRGYVVRIVDIDAEQTLPAMEVFTTEDAARAYAIKCAAWDDDEELPL
jgi:hypothetical protein